MSAPTTAYSLTFHELGGKPVVSWPTPQGGFQTHLECLAQFERWDKSFQSDGKHKPSVAFFEYKGEYIVRAAKLLGAKALVLYEITHNTGIWKSIFDESPAGAKGPFKFCDVHAVFDGGQCVVTMHLPTDELAVFHFKKLLRDK